MQENIGFKVLHVSQDKTLLILKLTNPGQVHGPYYICDLKKLDMLRCKRPDMARMIYNGIINDRRKS